MLFNEIQNKMTVICMISDFFYPNIGGVEEHIFQLSQCLINRKHKVIVVTHRYGNRIGIRYMSNGLKVYYLPLQSFYNNSVLPTFFSAVSYYREIFIREEVTIVHGHSAFSTMSHEALHLAKTMGLKCVFTDHSLFGFADTSAIVTNNFLALTLSAVDHCICVSYTSKENTCSRAKVDPDDIFVIPNGIDTKVFQPNICKRPKNKINVIICSRLEYRKGIDFQPHIIEYICKKYQEVNFLVAGEGRKRSVLEETRDRVGSDRIKLLGSIPHSEVHDLLVQGHIFLNTSLTEAFCMSILEAALTGLQVVSTNVGGIPEVLPMDFIELAEPNRDSLIQKMELAINRLKNGSCMDPYKMSEELRKHVCHWDFVAERTEAVYSASAAQPRKTWQRCGFFANLLMIFLVSMLQLYIQLLEILRPRSDIDICPNTSRKIEEVKNGQKM